MDLPINPPVEPMLAKSVAKLPTTPGVTYEPKWDGFRCIVFRDGDEVELASRGGKSMTATSPRWSIKPAGSCPSGARSTAS